ncbi:MAG: sigma-70 family RNA polymerase sigma factor [Actinomycetales bacterium]|nr:sigma-70 family RNA polymerase sigma factor [Actinomycetales bacterium]
MSHTLAERDFAAVTDPLRGELIAHCYRMLGSVQDAEDQVQETYLRAWRAFGSFEGRSSVRTWMYRIATRTCLTALEQRARRPLPTGLGAPSADPTGVLDRRPELPWLEPLPDALVASPGTDPAAVTETREGIRLAFVAALQHLTPLQRAVLILRDVLAFSAAETAETLGVTVPSANSALQRARAGLDRLRDGGTQEARDGSGALGLRERDLLDRYMRAFANYDTEAVVALLTEDVTWEMPPFTGWYQGPSAVGALIRTRCPARGPDDLRLLPTAANGQPACAVWLRGEDGVHHAFQLHVLDVATTPDGPAVRHVACFFDVALFRAFGLPQVHPASAGAPGEVTPAPL